MQWSMGIEVHNKQTMIRGVPYEGCPMAHQQIAVTKLQTLHQRLEGGGTEADQGE